MSHSMWVPEESQWRRTSGGGAEEKPTGQHALVHDAGSLNQCGVAGHDHPVGRDHDDVTGHEVRGHGLVKVWGRGHEDRALQNERRLFVLRCVISWDLPLFPLHTDTRTTLCAATMSCSMTNCWKTGTRIKNKNNKNTQNFSFQLQPRVSMRFSCM